MENLSQRLRELMQHKELVTGKELSAFSGVSEATIHRLLAGGTKPSKSVLQSLANAFNLSLAELIEAPAGERTELHQEFSVVPVLSWENIAVQVQKLLNKTISKTESITVAQKIEETAFALIVDNSSLEPRFPEGTKLIFRADTSFKHRDYILVKDGQGAILKQVLIEGREKFLKSLNTELNYPISSLEKKDVIIGALIQSVVDYGE